MLGNVSFWLGFGLCLMFLYAPCGCWRTYCGPHCGHEYARVLASISRLLLSLRPCRSRSPFPSLAPSRWSPCTLRRWAYLTLSGSVLRVPSASPLRRSRLSISFAMSPLSHRAFADGHRHLCAVALQDGRLQLRWVPSESMVLAMAPPVLVCLRDLAVRPLELRSVFHTSCVSFRMYSWRSICQFNWLIRVPAATFP